MAEERAKRKLSAILSADVKGYSRLMGENELLTVQTLKEYRQVIDKLVPEYQGRVVDSPGDNVLAEFGSVVDAVECAAKIQEELKDKNAHLAEDRRMEFRIGVNLGDVIDDEGRIYGDGVNVAARVEGLAEGGGICISGTAFDQIGKKLPLGYEYLGEQEVKNIEKPIRVYKVLTEPEAVGKVIGEEVRRPKRWRLPAVAAALILLLGGLAIWNFYFRPPPIEPASVDKMAYPLPDKPSIAVLPFENLTGDAQKDYIADGFTEDLITALSRVPKLFVIARSSTFSYKGTPVKIQRIAEDLAVRYVLEGSVRQSKEKMRITAQLIDATTGKHLWADRYDRELKDIFALQDEITQSIIVALQVKLTEGEQARVYYAKGTESLEAYLKHLQSREYFMNFKMDLAKQAAREVIALDPEWAQGYSRLATLMLMDVWFQSSKSPKQSLEEAESLCKKAIQMDNSLALPHAILGQTYLLKRQFDDALYEGKLAVELCPSCADNMAWLGMTLRSVGRPEEAIQYLEKAIRLSPLASGHVYVHLGLSYFFAGQNQKAFDALKTAYNERSKFMPGLIGLAAVCAVLGEEDQAHDAVRKILELHPKFSLDAFSKTLPYKRQIDKQLLIDALYKAGLPMEPPLPLPDKPSIAVLPFENISGDPEQEYFSDGISEEIITALSKVQRMFVIARNSTFTYKGKPVQVQRVAKELGVRYVLEGSVRKSGDKVRITAQLVDAATGNHLWAERYDRDLKDIFTVQDEITMRIITALQVELTEGEQARISGKATDNLDAYLKELQAREHFFRMNKQGSMRARELAREAIELDPDYAAPYTMLSLTHMMDLWFRFTDSPEESMKLAVEAAEKAIAIDDTDPSTYVGLCMLYIMRRQHDEAIAAAERAIELSPSGAAAHNALGNALSFAGRHQEAIVFFKKAISLNPFPQSIYFRGLGNAYRMAGQYEEAITEYKKTLQQNPDDLFAHLGLAVAYSSLGRQEEARAEAAEVLRIHPKFSLEHFAKTLPYKKQSDVDYEISNLRKAGLN